MKSVSGSSGEAIIYTHRNGLLEFTLAQTLAEGEVTTVHLNIQGVPDNRFAFLECAFDMNTLSSIDSQDIGLFGFDPGLFHKDFVALMPGLRWLPISGPEKARDDPQIRPVDFFYIDLKVELPEGWLIAGPGRRNKIEENSKTVNFRFSPQAPVPEMALIASKYESRSIDVEGVTLEILIHKKHLKNVKILADMKENLREWTEDRLKEAKETGIGYPYNALYLVEIPNYMRTYGGGWRMDTVMAPPSMVLMREAGFPTVRFDSAFRNPENYKDREGGILQAKWDRVKTFFMNDFSGGNLLSGVSRNFFEYQTSAEGPESLALNFIMETLSNIFITGNNSYFSAHRFLTEGAMINMVAETISAYAREPLRTSSIVNQTMESAVSRSEVWDEVLGVSLKDMDPWENPARTVDVLSLKANAIVKSIMDTLGREKTGQLLASILQSHRGKTYSLDDVVEAGKELGFDLTEALADWLGSTNLPGFVCDEANIYRLSDFKDGNQRYQILFTIRNDETAPGFFRFVYYYSEGGKWETVKSKPVHLAGKSIIQYGEIVSRPPDNVFLEPYLSLNRQPFMLPLNSVNFDKIINEKPFEGIKALPYLVSNEDSIIVDDLDDGFSIIEDGSDNGIRITVRENSKKPIDHGLPVTSLYDVPSTWSRAVYTTSYGKYRHTLSVVGAGNGKKKAVFKADIPKAGQWNLELHLPLKTRIMPSKKWGSYQVIVTDSSADNHEINFDSKTALNSSDWNPAGTINLPKGITIVTITNKTDGDFVVADAIRWLPSEDN